MRHGRCVIESKAEVNGISDEFLERIEALDETPSFGHRLHARRYTLT